MLYILCLRLFGKLDSSFDEFSRTTAPNWVSLAVSLFIGKIKQISDTFGVMPRRFLLHPVHSTKSVS